MNISLNLNNDETQLINSFAALNGISVSELVKKTLLERIEDEYDLKAYDKAWGKYIKNPVTYSLDEIERELSADDI